LPAFPRVPGVPRALLPPPVLFGIAANGVAGAQLVAVTKGLGRSLGVKEGVLVTGAPVGSPAAQSGLQDGDVIVRVSGVPVRTVGEVRSLVGLAWERGEKSVELACLRAGSAHKVLLRWTK
jgi:S1-C subfamily serine protease